jgi:hypothetical protein
MSESNVVPFDYTIEKGREEGLCSLRVWFGLSCYKYMIVNIKVYQASMHWTLSC